MRREIAFLRFSFWLGVVLDAVSTVPMLIPRAGEAMFGMSGLSFDPPFLYVSQIGASLIPTETFKPRHFEEAVVQNLARKLGEQYLNSFLALWRVHGLKKLEKACGLAEDKKNELRFPLRKSPGAYVRWLLQNGKC